MAQYCLISRTCFRIDLEGRVFVTSVNARSREEEEEEEEEEGEEGEVGEEEVYSKLMQ